ncbi:hypothetical protein [Microbulbifer sp. SAOS-129_SWC]|uniref:hypothetical protein n=1 Tax=Microbulbifer sp. SAOS-129_SWC TaxID=3145235 RepID=UPI003216E585
MTFISVPYRRLLCAVCLLLVSSFCSAKEHPSYLSPKYCEGVVDQFVDYGMRSLDRYVNHDFKPEYRGGIRNTIDFLHQRSEWLHECDDYLADTSHGNVFYNKKLTHDIFLAITELARELQHVRDGVEYPDDAGGNNPAPFIKRRYDTLAKLVDRHHTRMLMKKQFQ